uniref:Chloride channel protein n=1 Tax=Strix occidentalis caurina TaxID=311401 RepID=A0A8D0FF38_STROC
MERPIPGGLRGEEEERVLVSQQSWRPCPEARRRLRGCLEWVKRQLFRVGEDWYFLFVLGVLMATISFMMDLLVSRLYEGSGIPELKTILTGVVLEDYLAIQNFGAKVVGLTCTLACGSTIFLGKVGPFVHLSAMAAAYLGKMRTSVTREYEDVPPLPLYPPGEVGVGAVAFLGIEVMSSHFAVRDYWRGFFAATCGAFMFRLLAVFNSEQGKAGAVCGLVGCAYLFCQRWLLAAVKENWLTAKLLATDKPVYTVLVVLALASITFPPGLGQLMASRLTMKEYLTSLFDNRTWGTLVPNASSVTNPPSMDPRGLWQEWCHPSTTIFGTLAFFLLMKFWMLILATTLPLPAGYFMPIFIYGESGCLLAWSEGGFGGGKPPRECAAAFSGSVTHAISTALLVCEATGHLGHVLPVVLAVLVANAITQKHQPSFYDGTIIVKKLPYLPPIRSRHMASYQVVVEEFMERRVVALAMGDGFEEVLVALDASADSEYPVVESAGSPTLVGTVSRTQLVTFLQSHEHPQAPQGEKLATAGTLGDSCTVEPIILQLSPWTSLHQAHHLFELLKLQRVFVTRCGELVGAVSRVEVKGGGSTQTTPNHPKTVPSPRTCTEAPQSLPHPPLTSPIIISA